jgi:hypothetical protein
MRNWMFCETQSFTKRPDCFAIQPNSFCIEFRETRSQTSFVGNPSSHRSHYWIIKKFIGFLKNPDPHQNLRDSDVTRCSSGSDTGVELGLEKIHFIFIFPQIFPTII